MKEILLNKDKRKKHRGWRRLRRAQHDTETTRQYTAQEIHSLAHSETRAAGIIRPNTGDLHLPSDFVEHRNGQHANRPPLVLVVIVSLALVFIAIIMYFVAQMPSKNSP